MSPATLERPGLGRPGKVTNEHNDSTKLDPGEPLLEADTENERDELEEFKALNALTVAFERFQRIKTEEAQDTALLIGELIRSYRDGRVSDEARRLRKSAAQKKGSLSVPSGIDAIRDLLPQLAASIEEYRCGLPRDTDKALDRASWRVWTLLRSSRQLPFWNRGPVTAEFETEKLAQIRKILIEMDQEETDAVERLFVKLATACGHPRKKAQQALDNALRVKVG